MKGGPPLFGKIWVRASAGTSGGETTAMKLHPLRSSRLVQPSCSIRFTKTNPTAR